MEESVQLGKSFEIAYLNRGSFLKLEGEYEKALDDFQAALQLNPDRVASINQVALILAAAPVDNIRNGKKALTLATRACELTNWENSEYLGTLAAAYAETGDFTSAAKWQKKSLETAAEDMKTAAFNLLNLYKGGSSFRLKRKEIE